MIEEVDVFELNGNQQSALIEKAPKEILNELCIKQNRFLKVIDNATTSSFEYREMILIHADYKYTTLKLELTQIRISGIKTKYVTAMIIPLDLALYVIKI